MTKRVARVVLPNEDLEEYFRGNMAVIEGLPDDATIVRMWDDPARMTFEIMFESEEFLPVGEGEEAPITKIVTAHRRVNNTKWHVCPNCHCATEEGDIISPKSD